MNNFTKLSVAFFVTAMFSSPSWGGGYTTKIDKDGKTHFVENPSKFSDMITCGSLKASLSLGKSAGEKPNIMVLLVTGTGNDGVRPVPKRLIAEFDNYIKDYHTLDNFKAGCLSGDGGVGMIFQSSDPNMDAAYVQLDKYGRLFSKFNQTGYVLREMKP